MRSSLLSGLCLRLRFRLRCRRLLLSLSLASVDARDLEDVAEALEDLLIQEVWLLALRLRSLSTRCSGPSLGCFIRPIRLVRLHGRQGLEGLHRRDWLHLR